MKFQKLADMVLRGIADCGMRIAELKSEKRILWGRFKILGSALF